MIYLTFTLFNCVYSWIVSEPLNVGNTQYQQCQSFTLYNDIEYNDFIIPSQTIQINEGCQGVQCCGDSDILCKQKVSADGRLFQHQQMKTILLCYGGLDKLIEIDQQNIRTINVPIEVRTGHRVFSYETTMDSITRKYIVIMGGQLSSGQGSNQVWQYEVAWAPLYYYNNQENGNTWSRQQDLPISLFNFAITQYKDQYFIHGGQITTTQYNNKLYLYQSFILQEIQIQDIISISKNIVLWDGQQKQIVFNLDQYADFSREYLISNNQQQYKIESQPFQSYGCIDSIPSCIVNHQILYYQEQQAIFLFGGSKKDDQTNQINWVFILGPNIWTHFQHINQNTFDFTNFVQVQLLYKRELLTFSQGNFYLFCPSTKQFYELQREQFYNKVNWPSTINNPYLMTVEDQIFLLFGDRDLVYFTESKRLDQATIIYGLAQCDDGWKGPTCDQKQCPGLCLGYIPEQQFCYECYGNGQCVGGRCRCNEGYTGNDCSIISNCLNDCQDQDSGICIQLYPLPQCRCNEAQKRGGDDCSVIFCLNDCSNNGQCIDGVCQCNQDYIGQDCSVLGLQYLENYQYLIQLQMIFIILICQ